MEKSFIRHELATVAAAIESINRGLRENSDLQAESKILKISLDKLRKIISELDEKPKKVNHGN